MLEEEEEEEEEIEEEERAKRFLKCLERPRGSPVFGSFTPWLFKFSEQIKFYHYTNNIQHLERLHP